MFRHLRFFVNNPHALRRTTSGIGEKYYKKQNEVGQAFAMMTVLTFFGVCSIKKAYGDEGN